jgi:hypothetical protein
MSQGDSFGGAPKLIIINHEIIYQLKRKLATLFTLHHFIQSMNPPVMLPATFATM